MKARMKGKGSKGTILRCVLFLAVFLVVSLSTNVYASEETRSKANPEEWEIVLQLYGWISEIDSTTAGGYDIEFDFDDILDNLDFTFMGVLGARKNRWTFMTEVIYLDMEEDSSVNLNQALQLSSRGMQNWIVNPFVSYELFGSNKGSFQVLAGARYLDIEVDTEFRSRPPFPPKETKESQSGSVWDGIIGVRGFYNLTDRWFIPYRADIGTGDSDLTWHAFAGIGYTFDSFKLVAVYRYMNWEFDEGEVLDDLSVTGPAIGVIFTF